MRVHVLAAAFATTVTACTSTSGPRPKAAVGFEPAQLVKGDIDRVADTHRREVFASLRLLAEKLYRRNPREWRKGGNESLEAAVARLLQPGGAWRPAELAGRYGSEAVLLALREDYRGDRVAAFIGGLAEMIDAAFGGKSEFFMIDDLDPQKLYNSARNIEIAAWKLAHARLAGGAPAAVQ